MTADPAPAEDVLDLFSPATRAWFSTSFAGPTTAQEGAWRAISSGAHALVVAPTGSGKTLSAFLWALDRLVATEPPAERLARCRVLYVSPLKALAVDVERNLRSPLVGIGHAATRLGLEAPQVGVSVRSGDTPANERRAFARTPTDVLITTPESLFLMLTSAAREALVGVETIIIDEIHALAGTKRGAHLALSLERLDALLPQPAQRIGLSATVRPVEEIARYLAGGRLVEVVAPPSTKQWDLDVVVPVPDLADLGQEVEDLSGPASGQVARTSIWPHVEEQVVDLVTSHDSTLVFVNSRRLAERLTTRLNEIHAERLEAAALDDGAPAPAEGAPVRPAGPPAQVMAQAGTSSGAPAILARAHHGSVSKEQRDEIEEDLKAGRLPCVVATSSLELGIDMGAIDLVVQIESPPSVASGLQRVGRAGHQVGAVSHGVVMPKFRGDLVQATVVVERMRQGAIESIAVPANPLDVLAQQVVAMCALDDWSVEDLGALVRRAAPFASLPDPVLTATLDMLAGAYPSEDFAELRPRVVWDRVAGTLTGRRGAQRLAVTSGGTIPDRGLFGVFLATGEGPGRRVGELDEEMVYESRVGDVFTLGTSSWRVEDITHDRVLVSPAPGQPGKLPFWHGDQLGRPAELGEALGATVRELVALSPEAARERLSASGLDTWAVENLLAYLGEQRAATRHVPDDRTIVVERFRDEIGDWRVAVLSPFGGQVHAPWALAISARMRERFGVEVQAMHGDDGIVLRLPDLEFDDGAAIGSELLDLVTVEPSMVLPVVTEQVGGSALFASRFRECAARALLLPRRRPDRRQPLWQQRQRAASLLEVASRYPSFPIILETVREVLQDVYDVPGLVRLMEGIDRREITLVELESPRPSPFAASLMFGYVAQFLYEGDSPLAERRAAALTLDPALLADLLGQGEQLSLADLLDVEAVQRTQGELQRLAEGRRARDGEDVADLVRTLGPITVDDLVARSVDELDETAVRAALEELRASRQVIAVQVAGQERWAVVEDAGRLRDALGVPLPVGVPQVFLEPVADPLGDLLSRYARTHTPFAATEAAAWLGVGAAVARDGLRRLVQSGRVVEGDLRPAELGGGGGSDFCDAEVLRLLRRRSLAALRHEVEPVAPEQLAVFVPAWQGVGATMRGEDGLVRVVEQLGGVRLPASALESLVLPSRVADYTPGMLDSLVATGEVVWAGHGSLPGDDGWVSLHLADTAHLTLPAPDREGLSPAHESVLEALDGGGSFLFRRLSDEVASIDDEALADVLWDLVWRGLVTGDTAAPVRGLLAGGRSAHKTTRRPAARTRYGRRTSLGRAAMPARSGPPRVAGRWSLLPEATSDATVRTHAFAEGLLDRHGVLTRGAVQSESVPGGFAAIHRVLSAAEEAGQVRRGYFVEGLGGSQFALPGAVDQVRSASGRGQTWVLAATDPANPYGAALPWPPSEREGSHQPGRKAGALVVLVDGRLVLYVERGGRTLLSWTDDPEPLAAAARGLAGAVTKGALGRLTVQKADGQQLLGSDHPLGQALEDAGFTATPRGLRLRQRPRA
ncbi:ATP-dependent helicase [Janibacter melonis]|uniref:ATP-dependent helicase n=2 Tax=Janibacter melonis TaxID=262209 RepID=A0A650GE76_9MICO|nr:ATP-dependent helicase [Janibacter melonis]QGX08274.1 ATP-dependent helicase [Janibacter melonis]